MADDIVITDYTDLPIVQFDYWRESQVCEITVVDRHGWSQVEIRGDDALVVARAILATHELALREARRG